MKDFPFFKTKIENFSKKFNFFDPAQEREYFFIKAGKEIEKIRNFLKNNSFIAYLIGKKNSGKGTYAKMFSQFFEKDLIAHFSVGDIVRKAEEQIKEEREKKELLIFLKKYYRGSYSLEESLEALVKREASKLLPLELILVLLKREILKEKRKTIFIDGFPRNLDQVSFSLFFRDLIDFREDPDIFVLLSVPESVIEERIKWRRICPQCQTPRNLKLLSTKKVGFDQEKKEFYLICDQCQKRMVKKEFDDLGLEVMRERLKNDEMMIERISELHGVPKIFLRNSIPKEVAFDFVDDYEITPEYFYQYDPKKKEVIVKERPWVIKDDQGREAFSLLPQPVMVSFFHQLVKTLNL
ncbi:MAG: nucleoside monophosphate kinase [Minisyncoccales bacterium]